MDRSPVRARLTAALPLLVPVLAGLAYLAVFAAPLSYLLTNAAAFGLAMLWIGVGPALDGLVVRRLATVALLVLLFVPLASGPSLGGVNRWLPLGPFTIHAGMLALPSLAVLAARDPDYGAPILLTALLAAFLQPDAATGFAVTFAAVALHDVTKDWKIGVTAVIAFFATLVMAMRGELPPQPLVERVFVDLIGPAPLAAAALFVALMAGFFLMLWTAPAPRAMRYAMAGALFGFALMAVLSHYPTPLVGYGAAPILGFGLALGLARSRS